jgi:hypothetical protein
MDTFRDWRNGQRTASTQRPPCVLSGEGGRHPPPQCGASCVPAKTIVASSPSGTRIRLIGLGAVSLCLRRVANASRQFHEKRRQTNKAEPPSKPDLRSNPSLPKTRVFVNTVRANPSRRNSRTTQSLLPSLQMAQLQQHPKKTSEPTRWNYGA